MSNSLRPHGLKHTRPLCPLSSLEFCPSSCPLHWWLHLTISSSNTLLSFCPQSFPASGTFPMSQLFESRWSKYWSFCFSNSPSTEYSGLISLQIDLFDLLVVQGTLRSLLQHHSLRASISRHSAFFMVQHSQLYMTIGKTIALTIWTFISRVMSLLFHTLSRFVIAFLPRSKHLISWLQSPYTVLLEPKKRKSVTTSIFSLSMPWS